MDSGATRSPESRERSARFITGAFGGVLIGAAAGSVHGYRQLDSCEADCLLDPRFEVLLFAIMGGSAGGILGGLGGYLWPQRSARGAELGVAPSRQGGVAVSLSVRH